MTIMPATGIAMGYYGGKKSKLLTVATCFAKRLNLASIRPRFQGKGLPFFYTTLPGVVTTEDNKKSNGNIAKQVRLLEAPPCFIDLSTANFCFVSVLEELQNSQDAWYLR